MKKIITSLLVVTLIMGTLMGCINMESESKVYAMESRAGYILSPVKQDSMGIAIDTIFEFKAIKGYKLNSKEDIESNLSISKINSNKIELEITKVDDVYIIKPKENLEKDALYIAKYKEITWIFKTETKFALISVFPRNEAVNVPINTGIEFNFNNTTKNIEQYFDISPKVKGSFETHNNTVVFVPENLEYATVYTVTLKRGIERLDSNTMLENEYRFSFETENEKDNINNIFFNFNNILHKLDSINKQQIQYYYYNSDKINDEGLVNIYTYNNSIDFMQELIKKISVPSWSYYATDKVEITTQNLNKVMSFKQEISSEDGSINLPNKLQKGYYVIEMIIKEHKYYTFVQVSDLSYGSFENSGERVFWINNLKSKESIENAIITEYNISKDRDENMIIDKYYTNKKGLVKIKEKSIEKYMKAYVIEKDKQECIAIFHNEYNNTKKAYWTVFDTDKPIYRPNDIIKYFGFVRDRYINENSNLNGEKISVSISNARYYYFKYLPYKSDDMEFVTNITQINNNFYKGELKLPNLKEGYYSISIKIGDREIYTSYIEIKNYVKPVSKLEFSANKKAIMYGEEIKFKVNSSFFDGTPIVAQDLIFNAGGNKYKKVTNDEGISEFIYKPRGFEEDRKVANKYVSINTSLAEMADIYKSYMFRIFYNDITFRNKATLYEQTGKIEIQANKIDLSRINNGTNKYYNDYLGDVVKDLRVKGEVYKNKWVKKETGTYYDYINKETRKTYTYNLEKEKYTNILLNTDKNGKAEIEIRLPKEEGVYYSIDLSAMDGNNKLVKDSLYFGKDYKYYNKYEQEYQLELSKNIANIEDKINLNIIKNKQLKESSKYLYIVSGDGICEYDATDEESFEFKYNKKMIPSAAVSAVVFNGKDYELIGNKMVKFNKDTKEIKLDIVLDKKSYKPGDNVKIKLKGSYIDGETAKNTYVNLALVDEALLSVREKNSDILENLYNSIYNSYSVFTSSDDGFYNVLYGKEGCNDCIKLMENESFASDTSVQKIRENFKDVAIYENVVLNQNGEANIEFKLADNITSWRIMALAINKDLYAGSKVENVIVSMPFFANVVVDNIYLKGDKPEIGVTCYGTELKNNENISIEAELLDQNDRIISKSIKNIEAFKRSNISVGTLSEGSYSILVKAKKDKYLDIIKIPINVIETYRKNLKRDVIKAEKGLKIKTNETGNTTLTFFTNGIEKYYMELIELSYANGKRIEQKYLSNEVKKFLNKEFDSEFEIKEMNINEYVNENGSISILPYATGDLDTTIKMLDIVKDELNTNLTKLYLENLFYDNTVKEKAKVLYGISLLKGMNKELYEYLENYTKIKNITTEEKLYAALTYEQIGDTYKAKKLFEENILKNIEKFEGRAYVNVYKQKQKNIIVTELAMILTQNLNLDISKDFFKYIKNSYSNELLSSVCKYNYIKSYIEKSYGNENSSLKYNYNGKDVEVDFKNNWKNSITIPSKTTEKFSVIKVLGDINIVATYYTNDDIKNIDENIMVNRTYYNNATNVITNMFKEGDIVKVELNYSISENAIDDYYVITDYLPSGLKIINLNRAYGLDTSYYWYKDVEHQKVSYYVSKYNKEYKPIVYYARISNVGEFNALETTIQGTIILDSFNKGKAEKIFIK